MSINTRGCWLVLLDRLQRKFSEGDGSQKEGLDFDDTWEAHPCKKTILMEQRKARAWQDLCCLWKAWVVWTDPSAAVSRLTKASYSIAANLRLVAVQRHKLAELTDQVRKAMRVDWCAHVDRQALEAQMLR